MIHKHKGRQVFLHVNVLQSKLIFEICVRFSIMWLFLVDSFEGTKTIHVHISQL